MEKEVKVDGKTFEAKCRRCPSMLAFNHHVAGKRNQVTVTCGLLYPECELTKEEKDSLKSFLSTPYRQELQTANIL